MGRSMLRPYLFSNRLQCGLRGAPVRPGTKLKNGLWARVLQFIIEAVVVLLMLDLLTGFISLLFAIQVFNPVDLRSRWLSGRYAIDCGHVKPREDRRRATDCALQAEAQGQAFRVRYDSTGIDNHSSVGIVRTPSGLLYEVFYGWEIPGPGSSLLLKGVRTRPCPAPTRLFVNSRGEIDCFPRR